MYPTEDINKAMEELAFTNEKAGVYAGLASKTVSLIRNGDQKVNLQSLKKLANILNLQVEIRFTPKAGAATLTKHSTL